MSDPPPLSGSQVAGIMDAKDAIANIPRPPVVRRVRGEGMPSELSRPGTPEGLPAKPSVGLQDSSRPGLQLPSSPPKAPMAMTSPPARRRPDPVNTIPGLPPRPQSQEDLHSRKQDMPPPVAPSSTSTAQNIRVNTGHPAEPIPDTASPPHPSTSEGTKDREPSMPRARTPSDPSKDRRSPSSNSPSRAPSAESRSSARDGRSRNDRDRERERGEKDRGSRDDPKDRSRAGRADDDERLKDRSGRDRDRDIHRERDVGRDRGMREKDSREARERDRRVRERDDDKRERDRDRDRERDNKDSDRERDRTRDKDRSRRDGVQDPGSGRRDARDTTGVF